MVQSLRKPKQRNIRLEKQIHNLSLKWRKWILADYIAKHFRFHKIAASSHRCESSETFVKLIESFTNAQRDRKCGLQHLSFVIYRNLFLFHEYWIQLVLFEIVYHKSLYQTCYE